MDVNGVDVSPLSLNSVIPLLQDGGDDGNVVRIKLARLISIPERDNIGSSRANKEGVLGNDLLSMPPKGVNYGHRYRNPNRFWFDGNATYLAHTTYYY